MRGTEWIRAWTQIDDNKQRLCDLIWPDMQPFKRINQIVKPSRENIFSPLCKPRFYHEAWQTRGIMNLLTQMIKL